MFLNMSDSCLRPVMARMMGMPVCDVRMVCGLLVVTAVMVLRCFTMMFCSVLMMLGSLGVMICSFL
jgi:hypothetical protein